jgi:tricorn protease
MIMVSKEEVKEMRSFMRAFPIALVVVLLAAPAAEGVDARMLRYPDVSESQITFAYAGDIWVVGKQGGTAQRLSSPLGHELFPRFSPDGNQIAFCGNYDGNNDIYILPASGGVPQRVTYHPAGERLLDWTADGTRLLFASSRTGIGAGRASQLYLTPISGGLAEKLPVAYGEFASLSPDGKQMVFTTKDRGGRNWKRYRGGMAPDLYLFNLEDLSSQSIASSEANDMQPMWHRQTIYFLSDRDSRQRMNLWAYDLASQEIRQVTHFEDVDVSYPGLGPLDIVFQAGSRLYLMELATERYHEVEIEVITDLAGMRPHTANVGDLIMGAGISPTGKRALFEARGNLFTVPAEHGVIRQITRTSGVAERYPAWSPDGKQIAYWSDRSGEYELTLRASSGVGEETTLTELGPGFRYPLFWSPDSKKIAFIDQAQEIRVIDVESRKLTEVDKGLWMLHYALQSFSVSWSSDSRWLAYSRGLETENTAVFLFDTKGGERHQVTSGYYSDSEPVFDPDGKYLYYLSNRSLEPIFSDLDDTWVYPNTTRIVAVPLRKDVPSPMAPRNDEEDDEEEDEADNGKDDDKADDKKKSKGKSKGKDDNDDEDTKKDEPEEVLIDLERFEERVVVLPPERGNYTNLQAVSGKVLFHRFPRTGAADKSRPVVFFDFEEREEKTVVDNVSWYQLSSDGKKLLVNQDEAYAIIDVAPGQKIEERLPTKGLESVVDPREEWRQVFNEVWRTYRDSFYDPNMHGLDWQELHRQYSTMLKDAVTRWDVNFVIGELIGEVNASHTYVGGGQAPRLERRQIGLLGVDWELADGAYRVARIIRGAPWDAEHRSPLAEPGVDVKVGDYILAVNGVPLDTNKEPAVAFASLSGVTVALTVNSSPTTEGAREVLVETMASDYMLRVRDWVEQNRQRVDQASDGKIGYIFVPNTSIWGLTELVRQLASQVRREGLIIDERFNGGGMLPNRFIEQINRKMVTRIAFRHGATATVPSITHYGPKVMLINGWAGSGGDAFPYFFKHLEVGPIIGERTWGGLIGPAVGHRTIDGGYFTAPPGRLYGPDGTWFAEGHGVDPDIPVSDDPSELAAGRDPQLERAIAEVLRLLDGYESEFVEPPPFEDRTASASADGG